MEQHDRRTATQYLIGNLGVATLDMNHQGYELASS